MFRKNENKFQIIGAKKGDVIDSLEAGLYTLDVQKSFFGKSFNLERTTRYAETAEPKSGVFAEASLYINRFFTEKYREVRKSLGMLNKLNVIFNGKPGTGKTHMACALAEKMVRERNAIGVVINDIEDIDFGEFIDKLRINDAPNRLVVLVLDELEKNERYALKSSKFLGFLDGAESRENVIIVGTSNDIHDLPSYLTNRPGRFEKIWEFAFSNKQVLRDTVIALLPESRRDDNALVDKIVEKATAKKLETIDHVRFLMVDIIHSEVTGEEEMEISSPVSTTVEEDDAPKMEDILKQIEENPNLRPFKSVLKKLQGAEVAVSKN